MAAKNKFMNAMKMPAIADMFSSEADRQRESGDLVTEVPLSELHPFVNHPFEVRDDEDMQKLVDSIKENGVLTNLTVRPRAEGGYEIISGHRRCEACRELGIETVAVYSQADADALHVQLAGQAVCIGPARAADSYLNQDALLTVAKATGCDGVHPGYGFLSETADFADACAAAGLTFIGPSGDAIRKAGSKSAARDLMRAAGVPVTPGCR